LLKQKLESHSYSSEFFIASNKQGRQSAVDETIREEEESLSEAGEARRHSGVSKIE